MALAEQADAGGGQTCGGLLVVPVAHGGDLDRPGRFDGGDVAVLEQGRPVPGECRGGGAGEGQVAVVVGQDPVDNVFIVSFEALEEIMRSRVGLELLEPLLGGVRVKTAEVLGPVQVEEQGRNGVEKDTLVGPVVGVEAEIGP